MAKRGKTRNSSLRLICQTDDYQVRLQSWPHTSLKFLNRRRKDLRLEMEGIPVEIPTGQMWFVLEWTKPWRNVPETWDPLAGVVYEKPWKST